MTVFEDGLVSWYRDLFLQPSPRRTVRNRGAADKRPVWASGADPCQALSQALSPDALTLPDGAPVCGGQKSGYHVGPNATA